jgi:hypothetical protein
VLGTDEYFLGIEEKLRERSVTGETKSPEPDPLNTSACKFEIRWFKMEGNEW